MYVIERAKIKRYIGHVLTKIQKRYHRGPAEKFHMEYIARMYCSRISDMSQLLQLQHIELGSRILQWIASSEEDFQYIAYAAKIFRVIAKYINILRYFVFRYSILNSILFHTVRSLYYRKFKEPLATATYVRKKLWHLSCFKMDDRTEQLSKKVLFRKSRHVPEISLGTWLAIFLKLTTWNCRRWRVSHKYWYQRSLDAI